MRGEVVSEGSDFFPTGNGNNQRKNGRGRAAAAPINRRERVEKREDFDELRSDYYRQQERYDDDDNRANQGYYPPP